MSVFTPEISIGTTRTTPSNVAQVPPERTIGGKDETDSETEPTVYASEPPTDSFDDDFVARELTSLTVGALPDLLACPDAQRLMSNQRGGKTGWQILDNASPDFRRSLGVALEHWMHEAQQLDVNGTPRLLTYDRPYYKPFPVCATLQRPGEDAIPLVAHPSGAIWPVRLPPPPAEAPERGSIAVPCLVATVGGDQVALPASAVDNNGAWIGPSGVFDSIAVEGVREYHALLSFDERNQRMGVWPDSGAVWLLGDDGWRRLEQGQINDLPLEADLRFDCFDRKHHHPARWSPPQMHLALAYKKRRVLDHVRTPPPDLAAQRVHRNRFCWAHIGMKFKGKPLGQCLEVLSTSLIFGRDYNRFGLPKKQIQGWSRDHLALRLLPGPTIEVQALCSNTSTGLNGVRLNPGERYETDGRPMLFDMPSETDNEWYQMTVTLSPCLDTDTTGLSKMIRNIPGQTKLGAASIMEAIGPVTGAAAVERISRLFN